MKDFYSSITDSIGQRVGNPFVGSYFIAALLSNWQFVLLLFSGLDYREKISGVHIIYPSYDDGFIMLFVIPFFAAIFWVFLWPFINKIIMLFWYEKQTEVENARISAEKRKILTEEHATRIYEKIDKQRKEYLDLTADREQSIEKLYLDKQDAESKIIDLRAQLSRVTAELQQHKDEVNELAGIKTKFDDFKNDILPGLEYLSGVRTIFSFLKSQNDYSARADFFKTKICEQLQIDMNTMEKLIRILIRVEVIKYENGRVTFGERHTQVEGWLEIRTSSPIHPKV